MSEPFLFFCFHETFVKVYSLFPTLGFRAILPRCDRYTP